MNLKSICFISALYMNATLFSQNYIVGTVAGTGAQGLIDGQATSVAELYHPYGVAYDGDSIIYFSDGLNNVIRKLNLNNNIVTTIAGNGSPGLVDGSGAAARFNTPDDVFYQNGFLYVGDNGNNCIRKIDVSTYSVTTIAGTGVAGYLDGPANQAKFKGGNGIALVVAANGDIYVADGSNAVIRLISNGQVTTLAGTPGVYGYVDGAALSAKFHRPRYLELDPTNGDLYITDINNNVIRKLSNGNVSTFSGTGVAGGTDGPANVATFSDPVGIARTYNGYFYVVDGGGNKLRKVSPAGAVTTIAGNGVFGFQDGPATSAEFYYPQDICYDKHCFIYMSDLYNNRIRSITIPEGPAGCTLGIDRDEYTVGSVYPNPTNDVVTINNPSNERVHYELMNSIGEKVLSGETNSTISMAHLSKGIYYLNYKFGSQTRLIKVSLQ